MKSPLAEKTSRDDSKRETRRALIEAGLAEFFEHGLDVPSLDAICARAGYTRGAFYVHFRDREEFMVAVVDFVLGNFLDLIIAVDTQGQGLEEAVQRFALAVDTENPLIGANGSMRTHQLFDACVRSEAIRARVTGMLGEAMRRLEHAARAGRRAGTTRRDIGARPLAATLVALALGVVQLIELGMTVDLDEIHHGVLQLLREPRRG